MLEKDNEELKIVIREIFDASKQRFGARRIKAKLDEIGRPVSEKRISRWMREMNLVTNIPLDEAASTKRKKNRYRKDRLGQQFMQSAPNEVWVGDSPAFLLVPKNTISAL